MLAPRTRHTIAAPLLAFSAGGEEEILDTVAVVVRPRPLELNVVDIAIALAPNDKPGALVGQARARYGEGDYEFSINSSLLAIDETGLVFLTGTVGDIDTVGYTVTVRAGDEIVEDAESVFNGLDLLVWEVEPSSLLITAGITGKVADINFTAASRNEMSDSFYLFTVVNSGNAPAFPNINNFSAGIDSLRLNSPFTAAQAGELEVLAVQRDGVRTLTATVTVRVVEPLTLAALTATAGVNISAGILITARAAGGGGDYTYSLNSTVSQLTIDITSGEIGFTAAFLSTANYTLSVLAQDGEGRRTAAEFALVVEPSPLRLILRQSSDIVRTGEENIDFAVPAAASGGRRDYFYFLINEPPPEVRIGVISGEFSIRRGTPFNDAGVWTLTVQARDSNNTEALAFLTLTVLDSPGFSFTPIPAGAAVITITAGVFDYALAETRFAAPRAGYTHAITPPDGLAGKLGISSRGIVSITAAFLQEQAGTHEFTVAANSSEANFTATLTVQVVGFEPFGLSLTAETDDAGRLAVNAPRRARRQRLRAGWAIMFILWRAKGCRPNWRLIPTAKYR